MNSYSLGFIHTGHVHYTRAMPNRNLDDYRLAFRDAYEGECTGARLYKMLANLTTELEARIGFAAIADVEDCTYRAMRTAARRNGIAAREDLVEVAVVHRTSEILSQTWREFVGRACQEWPPLIPRFEALRDCAPAEDHAALERLVQHEVALVDFVHSAKAGNSMDASLIPVRRYCEVTTNLLNGTLKSS